MTKCELAVEEGVVDFMNVASGLLDRTPGDVAKMLMRAGLLYIEDYDPRLLSWKSDAHYDTKDRVDAMLDILWEEVGENPITIE